MTAPTPNSFPTGNSSLAGDLVGRLAAALLAERWGGDSDRDSHRRHYYYYQCAICRGDADRLAAWVVRFLADDGQATRKESFPLRDRMAAAIRQVVRISPGPNALSDLNAGRSIAISGGEADDAALAALPVVEAALTEAKQQRDEFHADLEQAERTIAAIQQACRTALLPPCNEHEAAFARRILHRLNPLTAVDRVRDLHAPMPCECVKCCARRHEGLDDQICAHCTSLLPQDSRDGGIRYPCPTITALDQLEENPCT